MQIAELSDRYNSLKKQIKNAELQFLGHENGVSLLAVSKKKSADLIRQVASLGQKDFAENYYQESLQKLQELASLDLTWHFIGPIQSNKTKGIAEHFHWVQSVDRLKIAQRLSQQRPPHMPELNICLQVNISGEESKSGFTPEEIPQACQEVAKLPRLNMRGLMSIPAQTTDQTDQRLAFQRTYQLFQAAQQQIPTMDTLSMGMSGDFEMAIAEHSTMVRVGTALFGQRD
jgi:PLP dependent protein